MHASTGVDYLLDDKYEDALTGGEREVKRLLLRVRTGLSEAAASTAAGQKVRQLLGSMDSGRGDSRSEVSTREVVVKVGAEGGTVTLVGGRTTTGWSSLHACN